MGDPVAARRWRGRFAHLVKTDPEGGFVAERDGEIVGVAQAAVRERLWCLSMFAVKPGAQSSGAGRALLERALKYRDGTDSGLIVSSNDPRALRLYATAGFALRPTFQAAGTVDRRALPRPLPELREATPSDLDALAVLSREIRGAPHTAELQFELARGGTILWLKDRGYAVVHPDYGIRLLVARDDHAATALLWGALERVPGGGWPIIRWITGEQRWAVEVSLRAGLDLSAYGALAVRGNPGPLWPFIPSPSFA
jgi:GNAT superfamily N-acetyltransferase